MGFLDVNIEKLCAKVQLITIVLLYIILYIIADNLLVFKNLIL